MKAVIVLSALALAAFGAAAHEEHEGHSAAQGKPAADAPAAVPLAKPKRDPQAYFTDRELLTQDGTKVRFYSDVLKGRMVVMNVIYTNCKDACPLITEQMNQVRAQLGDSFGKEIQFVTISSDPQRDSPQALKKFAQKHHADVPGWTFLTGKKENVDHILKKLGQFSEEVESHSTQLIAWNFKTDKGKKMLPNIAPEMIAAQLKMLSSNDMLELPLPALPRPN